MTGRPPTGRPLRTKTIKILATPELDALVTAAARREGRSVSDWGKRLFEREVGYAGPGVAAPGSPEQQGHRAVATLAAKWRTKGKAR